MGYTCVPQVMGLVQGEPARKANGQTQRHRANGASILAEAGSERFSASETLDRTRSKNNEYDMYERGHDCWDAMKEEAAAYKIKTKSKDGVWHERSLPKKSAIGFAVIFNPPHEMCKDWSDEEFKRFYDDSWQCLCKIEPRLFSDTNVRMTAIHKDEGRIADQDIFDQHMHRFGVPRDADGKYCGNLIDAHLMVRINKAYPQMMRNRGWQLDDVDCTDWDRFKTDEEYREERKAKRKMQGRSVNSYIRQQTKKDSKKAHELTENAIAATEEAARAMRQVEQMLAANAHKTAVLEAREAALDAYALQLDNRRREMDLEDLARRVTKQQQTFDNTKRDLPFGGHFDVDE